MPSLVLPQVVSMKYNEDLISVWNRESENNEAKRKIEETMRKVFGLPPGTILEYKAHAAALTSSNHPNPSE
jgi:translation initiation factor 4E